MIFVLELEPAARAWFSFDEADLLRKVAARAPQALALTQARFADDELLVHGLAAGPSRDAFLAVAALRECGPHRVFWDESAALAAFERSDDPGWQGEGWRARRALRDQLIALEVLADDL
jgi:hypothetical protein